MYRITYTQGNGYQCSCCRREYTETIDFETQLEVIEWLSELEACNKESRYEDDNDRCVDDIREIKDDDLTDIIKPDPLLVEKIVNERKAIKEGKKLKEAEDELARKKAKLEQLKKELGEN